MLGFVGEEDLSGDLHVLELQMSPPHLSIILSSYMFPQGSPGKITIKTDREFMSQAALNYSGLPKIYNENKYVHQHLYKIN